MKTNSKICNLFWLAVIATPLENVILLFFDNSFVQYLDILIFLYVWIALITIKVKVENTKILVSKQLKLPILIALIYTILWIYSQNVIYNFNYYYGIKTYISFIIKNCLFAFLGENIDFFYDTFFRRVYYVFSIIYGLYGMFVQYTTIYAGFAMQCGYDILCGSMICILDYFKKGKTKNVFFIFLYLLIFVVLGCRGALFIYLIFGLYIIFTNKLSKARIRKMIAIASLTILIVLVCFSELFAKLNTSNLRIIQLFSSNEIFADSGRNVLSSYISSVIKDDPLSIKGLYIDRILNINKFANTNKIGQWIERENYQSLYVHNITLELLVQFGVIIGSMLLIGIIYIIFKIFTKKSNRKIDKRINAVFVTLRGLFPLLVSSSYLESPWFYALIGFTNNVNN